MSSKNSEMPDLTGLNDFEREIFDFVLEMWPTNPIEIAENFKEDISSRENRKRLSSKYVYYLKKLIEKKLLISKKAGNSIIVWPAIVEKYRLIHDILKNNNSHSNFFDEILKGDINVK
jgi:predicted transcriptional regulator